MEIGTILKCIDKIGSEGFKGSQSVHDITNLIQDRLIVATKKNGGEIFDKNLLCFDEFSRDFEPLMQDERSKCAVNLLYLLYCTSYLCNEDSISGQESPLVTDTFDDRKKSLPVAPSNLLSVKHLKIIELCVEFLLYTVYFASLDEEAVPYLKLKIIRDKLVFGNNCLEISLEFKHKSLKLILKYVLPLVKHETIGKRLVANFLPEILCGLLQLCFSPSEIRNFPEDVEASREELEILLGSVLPLHMLKGILLLKGASAQRKGKSWMRSVCQSIFIRRFLLKEGGVLLTIEAALSLGDFGDWRKKETVAALVSSAKAPDEFEFFEKVCSQILTLVKEEKKGDILQLLAFMLLHLSRRSSKLTETYFFKPFLEPLVNLTSKGSISSATGKGLVQLISVLYKIFVEILPPCEMTSFLSPVVCPLSLTAALPPTCHVKTNAQLTLVRYLSQLENKDLVCAILTIAGLESSFIPPVNPGLKLISRLNAIEIEYDAVQQNLIDCDERNIKSLVEIIDILKIRSIVVDLVQRLSVYLDFTILNDFEVSSTQLLTEYDVNDIKFAKLRKLNIVVTLLNSICENENLTTDLFRDLGSAVPILDTLLKIHHQKPTDAGLAQTKETFLMNCVMLLLCYVNDKLASGKMTSSDWKDLRVLVPSLQALEKSHMQSLSGLAEQLIQMIVTHGTIGANENNVPSRSRVLPCNSNGFDGVSNPHINAPPKHLPNMDTSQQSPLKDSCKVLSTYQEALVDVCSPHLPIRGHALISLGKLVQVKDEEAMKNSERILSLFEHHLRDEDSYIYLASIKGIAALSAHFPQKVVTILTEEFSRSSQTIETRLKLIEVLTETSRLLGPVLPKYKNLFLNCLLNGVRDEEFLVRASCLSNLGEVCKELKFSVEPVVHEIFSVVHNIVQFDKSPEVKRAGVLFVTLLLQGLGNNIIKVLQDVILDLYRSLKKILITEDDPILITHSELAIEEINSITRDFLLPKLSLQKKIFITEVPSNPL